MPMFSPPPSDLSSRRRTRRAAQTSVHWQREVPEAIRSLDTLAGPNYADIVTATVGDVSSKTPDQWVQATLDGAPRGLLRFVILVQRMVLGLRLELRPSPDHLLGWRIVERGENWLRVEASSWFLTGHVVMHGEDGQLSFASFIRYDRPLAALVWPPVSLVHRQVALALVRRAARSAVGDA